MIEPESCENSELNFSFSLILSGNMSKGSLIGGSCDNKKPRGNYCDNN